MRDLTAERLCHALANLVSALCRDDVQAVEVASLQIQKLLEQEGTQLRRSLDYETLREIKNLVEAAQCLVWVKLLSASESGMVATNRLVREKV